MYHQSNQRVALKLNVTSRAESSNINNHGGISDTAVLTSELFFAYWKERGLSKHPPLTSRITGGSVSHTRRISVTKFAVIEQIKHSRIPSKFLWNRNVSWRIHFLDRNGKKTDRLNRFHSFIFFVHACCIHAKCSRRLLAAIGGVSQEKCVF